MEGKATSRMVAFIVPWACILFICVMLVICNAVTLSIECFGVDSQNQIYVGRSGEICVYNGDKIVNRISAQTSRSYLFTVLKNDNIMLSTASKVYVIDTDGNILSERDDVGTTTYIKMQADRRNFISHKGDQYQIRNILGRTKIVKNGTETVYQITVLSVVVKTMIALCIVSIILFFGIFLLEKVNENKNKTMDGFVS